MKKWVWILWIVVLTIVLATGCRKTAGNKNADGRLAVYASIYPMVDFAKKIGGGKIEVIQMVPAGIEPHDWEPTAADVVDLEQADVFIYNGAGMEHWVEKILQSLQNDELVIVEASRGISLLEGHGHEADHDGADGDHQDEDEKYDPHVWLSPINAQKQMEAIKNGLIEADPQNEDYYEENFKQYVAELGALDQEFRETLSTVANKDIIVAHQAFGYLCSKYGLNQLPIEGLAPDSEPDPARIAEIIAFAKAHQIKVIFFEELVSPKVAEVIAKAVGAQTDILNPIEGLSDEQQAKGDDYFSLMRKNLQALKNALQ